MPLILGLYYETKLANDEIYVS